MQTNSQDSHLNSLRQWANLMAIIAAFGINVLANLAPFNGLTIGEISNTVFRDVKIIPANYAFAIWGLIYLDYSVLPYINFYLKTRKIRD